MSAVFAKTLLNWLMSADFGLLLLTLVFFARARAFTRSPFFAGVVGLAAIHFGADVAIMFHRRQLGISVAAACNFLRYGGTIIEGAETILLLCAIYGIYKQLIAPMVGLHKVGILLFRWIAAISVCLAAAVAFGPHLHGITDLGVLIGQFQEGASVLTLCLLLALAFAARPLGLSAASRSFGMLLGLGMLATVDLVSANWFGDPRTQSPYSAVHLIGTLGSMAAAITWSIYFARPEPARRLVTLPTTSPFFFWNRVAEVLGDESGRVAIAGFTPDMLAPAELLAFSSPVRQPAPVVEMPHVARR